MNRLPPLKALQAFESAGRHLSFTLAAQELNVTPGAISQQIRQLEEFSGQRNQIFGLGEEKDNVDLQKNGLDAYIERPVSKEKILPQLKVFDVAG